LEIARRAGATLQLAHVNLLLGATFAERSLSFEETIGRHRQQQMRDYLAACSRRLAYEDIEVLGEALRGEQRTRDLEAIAGDDTLIVVATPYRGVLGCFQFGAEAERLLSIGSSPILFMKGYRWPVDLHVPVPIRRVLTYLDGSLDGEQIIPSASALAKAAASSHTLMRVVPTFPYVGVPWEEELNEAKAYLSATADRLRKVEDASRLATEIRSSDAPVAQVILTYAQNSKIDVVAVAARHRSKLSKLLRPDPAEYLVQYSRIPVLITRSRTI
jgi:nucleotide-binding universal stress UspA family protein